MKKLFRAIKRQFSSVAFAIDTGNGDLYSYRDIEVILSDGNLIVNHRAVSAVAFEMQNAIILGEKHLKTFVKCTVAAIEKTIMRQEVEYSNRAIMKVSLSYNDSVSTVRAILDDKDLSPQVKFAAIVSMLQMCPTLPFDDVKAIAIRQHEFISVSEASITRESMNPKLKNFFDLRGFLMPDFITTGSAYYSTLTTIIRRDPEFFRLFRTISSFIWSDGEKTFEQYAETAGLEIYAPRKIKSDSFAMVSDVVSFVSGLSSPIVDNVLKDLNSVEMGRFCKLYSRHESDLFDFYKDILRQGETHYEFTHGLWAWYDEASISSLSPYIPYEEMYSLYYDLKANFEDLDRFRGLESFGAPIVAYYYLNYGIEAVRELIDLVESDRNHSQFSVVDTAYSINNDGTALVTQRDFILAKTGEYSAFPLSWAINLIIDESNTIHAEKEESLSA